MARSMALRPANRKPQEAFFAPPTLSNRSAHKKDPQQPAGLDNGESLFRQIRAPQTQDGAQ